MGYTPESAYSEFIDVAGGTFEYQSGPSAGKMAKTVKYEISRDKQTLYFVMSDGNKINSKQFNDIMLQVGDGGAKKDFTQLASAGGSVEVNKSDNDILAEKLGLLSEEEEEAENQRRLEAQRLHQASMNGELPPPPSKPSSNPPSKPQVNQEDEYYPIFMLLDKRKNKPKVKIEVEVDLEFIDKNTYILIESTLDNATEGITKYFSEQVDLDKLKESFMESMNKYMVDNFDAEIIKTEPEEEVKPETTEEPKSSIKTGGGPVVTKKQEPKIEVVEGEVTPSEKK